MATAQGTGSLGEAPFPRQGAWSAKGGAAAPAVQSSPLPPRSLASPLTPPPAIFQWPLAGFLSCSQELGWVGHWMGSSSPTL